MILKLKHIRKILFATVTVILCSQIAWVYNMHKVYQKEFQVVVDNSLERAISREFSMRHFHAGGSTSHRFYSSIEEPSGESYIVEKTITSDDGRTFKVNIDTQDPDAMDKFIQFLIKESNPIDINKLKALSEARKKGFRNIRTHFSANEINLTNDYSLHNWLFDKEFPEENRSLFYDMFKQPFIKEENEIEAKFIEVNYYFEDSVNQILRQKCLGLTSTFLSETLAISFQSNPAWLKNTLRIIIEKDETISGEDVKNVYSKECFEQDSISTFVDNINTLNIVETDLNPDDKRFHLTSHHGQQELTDLWNRIKNSPYVVEGMSIEWGGNSFCKNPQRNGKIDIVDLKSDRRYALQIQTTGRNLRETKEIAKRLDEQYG